MTTKFEPGFTVRPIEPGDIPSARALMIRTFDEDFHLPYDPGFHLDVDDIAGIYITPPRHELFVAVDDSTHQIIGTGGVRGGALKLGSSPEPLVLRYDNANTAQIVRVYTLREHRRRGVAQAVLRAALEFILADGGYSMIALHTFPHSPGAMAFWEAVGTIVFRDQEDDRTVVYFEISLDSARRMTDGGE